MLNISQCSHDSPPPNVLNMPQCTSHYTGCRPQSLTGGKHYCCFMFPFASNSFVCQILIMKHFYISVSGKDDFKARLNCQPEMIVSLEGNEVCQPERNFPRKSQESDTGRSRYCLQMPCITLDGTLPPFIHAFGPPDPRNHSKRYRIYRTMYSSLKSRGLWQNLEYLQCKMELGCYLADVREIMPYCIIICACSKWSNPAGIP